MNDALASVLKPTTYQNGSSIKKTQKMQHIASKIVYL
jgi:hypothetical protein